MQGKSRERERETITSEYLLFTRKSRLTIPTNGNLLKQQKNILWVVAQHLNHALKRRFATNQSQVSPLQMTPTNRRHRQAFHAV